MHALVRDLNVVSVRQDERRIEVIANGLLLWAVDTTLVCSATPRQWPHCWGSLHVAERAKARTYPELASGLWARRAWH